MTATCPEPEPIIDRSFAAEPPRCVYDLKKFRFAEDAEWIELAETGAREIAGKGACLAQVYEWIESERLARQKTEGLMP